MGKESARLVEHAIYSNEEMNELKDIKNSINTYVNENQALFVMGTKSLEKEWDNYVKELDRIGLKKYLEITGKGYNRAMGR